MSALRALPRFDRARPLRPWLHRIVVNRAIDWARARRLRAEVGVDAVPEPAAPPADLGLGDLGAGARPADARAPGRGRHALPARADAGRDRGDARPAARHGQLAAAARARRARRRAGRSPEARERAPSSATRCAHAPVDDDARGRARCGSCAPPTASASPCGRRRRWAPALAVAACALAAAARRRLGQRARRRGRALGARRARHRPSGPRSRRSCACRAAAGCSSAPSDGAWAVAADGSRRRLGDYAGVSWSPHGLFVVGWRGGELVAMEPSGRVRWSLARPGRITAAPLGAGRRLPRRLPGRRHAAHRQRRRHRRPARWPPRRRSLRPGGPAARTCSPTPTRAGACASSTSTPASSCRGRRRCRACAGSRGRPTAGASRS